MRLYSILRLCGGPRTKPARTVSEKSELGQPGDRRHFLCQAASLAAGAAIASATAGCGLPDWAEATEADVLMALGNDAYAEGDKLKVAGKSTEANKLYRLAADRYLELARKYPQYTTKNVDYSSEKMSEKAAYIYHYFLEDYAAARAAYEFFVEIYPKSVAAPAKLMTLAGMLKNELGLPREAIKAYRKIMDEYSNSDQAPVASLAVAYIFQNDLKLINIAIALYEQHIETYKGYTDQDTLATVSKALLHLADIYYGEPGYQDLTKAVATYEQYLALVPTNDSSYCMGIALKVAGIKYDFAKAKTGPERQQAMAKVAKEYYDLVIKYKAKVFASKGTLIQAAETSGDIYSEELKDYQKAAAAYKVGVMCYGAPDYFNAEKLWLKMCTAYYTAKEYCNAYLVYLQFSDLYPNHQDAEMAYFLAVQCLKLDNKNNEAISLYEQFLKDLPNSQLRKTVLYDLGALYKKNYNFGGAIATYEIRLKDYPNSPEAELALFEVGSLNVYLKNYQAAVDAYEQFVSKYPSSVYLNDVLSMLKQLCALSGIQCQKAY